MDEFESFDRREARESALAFIATLLLLGALVIVGLLIHPPAEINPEHARGPVCTGHTHYSCEY